MLSSDELRGGDGSRKRLLGSVRESVMETLMLSDCVRTGAWAYYSKSTHTSNQVALFTKDKIN